MIKEEFREGGWLTNSGREIPGGIYMNVKDDDGTQECGSEPSALEKGHRRYIPE